MAPRKKSVSASGFSEKENGYLRSLGDYQARVRRRDTIRTGKPDVVEYDLERKTELELKMREASCRLLAASRGPGQTLEAARALLTSNERMLAYMTELQRRKRELPSKERASPTPRGTLSISDLRFPLMWRDSDHFKNRGDDRKFAVFCLARLGTEIIDTSLVCPVNREQTDISFPDVLVFNNVTPEFQLNLEIYAHMLQEDRYTIASTPRKIRRSIYSSISRTVGKKLVAASDSRNQSTAVADLAKISGPRFDLVASARLTLDDVDVRASTYDLISNNLDKKQRGLPLFTHFCCCLALRADSLAQAAPRSGYVTYNGQYCWAHLQNFQLDVWESMDLYKNRQGSLCHISIDKNISVEWTDAAKREFRITRHTDATDRNDCTNIIRFDNSEEAQTWFAQLVTLVKEQAKWKNAPLLSQIVPSGTDSPVTNPYSNVFRVTDTVTTATLARII